MKWNQNYLLAGALGVILILLATLSFNHSGFQNSRFDRSASGTSEQPRVKKSGIRFGFHVGRQYPRESYHYGRGYYVYDPYTDTYYYYRDPYYRGYKHRHHHRRDSGAYWRFSW